MTKNIDSLVTSVEIPVLEKHILIVEDETVFAKVVVFLASDAAEFTNGQTIYVDGGLFTATQWPYDT